jgi:hypothetical protein
MADHVAHMKRMINAHRRFVARLEDNVQYGSIKHRCG